MSTRTFVTKSGDTYEWDETPEVKKTLKEYHTKFYGNYPGPLYAPYPHIKDGKETN